MKQKIIITLLFIVCYNYLSSQILSNQISKSFSNSIIVNIYRDVLSKMTVPDSLQFKLAELYQEKDRIIFKEISKKTSSNKINIISDSLDYNIEIKFKKLLNPTLKREYFVKVERARAVNYPIFHDTIYMDIQMDSQFGLALAIFDKLNLKPNQKDSLIHYATLLKSKEIYAKQNPDSGYFDKAMFESENMPKCLSETEYNGLLSIKNKEVAEAYSKHTFYTLKNDKIIDNLEAIKYREVILYDLKFFYLSKATIWDKLANKPETRNILINQIPLPPILQKAITIKNKTALSLEKYSW